MSHANHENSPVSRMTQRLAGALAALVLLAAAQGAAAAYLSPLGLTQQNPDITVGGLGVTQVGGTSFSALGAGGVANFTDAGGLAGPILYSSYTLNLNLTGAGPLGTISILGALGGTLLAGDITAYGATDAGGGVFEFLYDITASDPAFGFGAQGGTILTLSQVTDPTGAPLTAFDDTSDFTAVGRSNNFAVSAPGTLALAALGVLGLAARRARGRA